MFEEDKTQAKVMGDCEQRKRTAQLKSLNPKRKSMEIIIGRKGVFGVTANTKVSLTPPSTVSKDAILISIGVSCIQRRRNGHRRSHYRAARGLPQYRGGIAVLLHSAALVLGLTDRTRLQGCMRLLCGIGSEVCYPRWLIGCKNTISTTGNYSERLFQRWTPSIQL